VKTSNLIFFGNMLINVLPLMEHFFLKYSFIEPLDVIKSSKINASPFS
jgi:hypothetical protein